MRIFGVILTVIGLALGLLSGMPGLLLLAIVGLLMMIAAPGKSKDEKPVGRQSTGGYAGMKKRKPHNEFDLGKGPPGRKKVKKNDDPYAGG